jgi:dihydrofolate synthase / folylpolyglutamate synthase
MNIADHPLHALPKYGDGIGLHRVRFLMEHCGIDADEVSHRAIAVTGSNGKGSTARIASELLSAVGGPVGLFTSPHLYRYNERFRIDGGPASDREILASMERVARAVEARRTSHPDAVGAFEAQFVVALDLFLTLGCRWLVLEAGIGGRYDPVRLARAPVSALVSLDLEHTELLGKTLIEIALDKLDATAPGGAAILGESCLPLREQILTYADLTEKTVAFVNPDGWRDLGVRDGKQRFSIDDSELGELRSRLIGRHQLNNHAVAIALVRERLRRSGQWPIAGMESKWRDAISYVEWPGRLETISSDPLVVIDVGHTPQGIKAALAGFRALAGNGKALLVTGGSKNKHVDEMLELLAPHFDAIVCTAAHHNGMAAETIEGLVKAINPHATTFRGGTISEAVSQAQAIAKETGCAVYVAGGLFLAAEFAEAWRGGDPAKLKFF